MLDSAALEKRGIHTVTIVWDNFENAARTQARLHGVQNLEMIVIPHRTGDQSDDDQRRKAEAAAPEIVRRLLKSTG